MNLRIVRDTAIKRGTDSNVTFAVNVEKFLDLIQKDIKSIYKEASQHDWVKMRFEVYKS